MDATLAGVDVPDLVLEGSPRSQLSNDLLAMISNDSPTDINMQSWGTTTNRGNASWHEDAVPFSSATTRTHRTSCANGSVANSAGAAAPVSATPSSTTMLPGGTVSVLPTRLSALASAQPQPTPRQPMGAQPHIKDLAALSSQHHGQPQAHAHAQPHMPFIPQRGHQPPQHPPSHHAMEDFPLLQGSFHQQQKAIAERDDEISRLRELLRDRNVASLQAQLRERDEELRKRDGWQAKWNAQFSPGALEANERAKERAKAAEIAALRAALTKEKEEKLAKLSAAHDKRVCAKDEEMSSLRSSLQREKDREMSRLEALHAKQLKARDEDVAQAKAAAKKESEERVSKLQGSLKELKAEAAKAKETKATLAARDAEISALRKQLGAAQRVEDDLRKAQASAASAASGEERRKNEVIAKLKGSIEQSAREEMMRQGEEREREFGSLTKQVAELRAQLAAGERALGREREKFREALLASPSLAEVSMEYSAAEEERLLAKVDSGVQECSVEEVHWLMTRTFRSWLSQSYNECDEVCDALEAEQQRLKRIHHSKEHELGKMRAHVAQLKGRIAWVYQVTLMTHVGGIATACVGAQRALSTGQLSASLQVMAIAWVVIFATASIFLFGDGFGQGPSAPPHASSLRRLLGARVRRAPAAAVE